jgi:hypothetical protein
MKPHVGPFLHANTKQANILHKPSLPIMFNALCQTLVIRTDRRLLPQLAHPPAECHQTQVGM